MDAVSRTICLICFAGQARFRAKSVIVPLIRPTYNPGHDRNDWHGDQNRARHEAILRDSSARSSPVRSRPRAACPTRARLRPATRSAAPWRATRCRVDTRSGPQSRSRRARGSRPGSVPETIWPTRVAQDRLVPPLCSDRRASRSDHAGIICRTYSGAQSRICSESRLDRRKQIRHIVLETASMRRQWP